jgi:hypothetical protein
MKLKTERYNFAFSKETSEKIKKIALKKTWKFSTVIEQAVDFYFDQIGKNE